MIKPRPPHQAADKFLRLAKAVAALGMDFEDAIVGVDHELIESVGASLPRLSRAMQTLSQDLRRRAMTPPPEPTPAPRPTPILDYLERREAAEAPPPPAEVVPPRPAIRIFAAFINRNPLFWLLAFDPDNAEAAVFGALGREYQGIYEYEAIDSGFVDARKLPDLDMFVRDILGRKRQEAHRADDAHPKVPAPHADDSPPTRPADDAMSGPPEPTSGPAAPEVRAYPTEGPRDPLATLPVEELGLRKPVLELVRSKGVTLAGQLFDELDGEVLDGLLTEEQRDHVEKVVDVWERSRATLLEDWGGWLGEELAYACFRLGDAREFWGKLREAGATDAELRDAINKRFFVMGGAECRYRVGYHFVSGPAPAFFKGAAKPKRGQEPALEGKPLVDAVRRLLAIPTREDGARGGKAKAAKARKAVANGS